MKTLPPCNDWRQRREYNKRWRHNNKEAVAIANKAYREKHPDYAKQWLATHPNYQQEWRQKNPMWRKAWYQRYKHRDAERQSLLKHQAWLLAQQISNEVSRRPSVVSLLIPNAEEYAEWADLPTKLRSLLELTGCKYLEENEFCNQPKIPNKPYCQKHSERCYLKGKLTDELWKGY